MLKIAFSFLLLLFCASSSFALSEADFQKLNATSPEFRRSDEILNSTWKKVVNNVSGEDKKFLLSMQREWLKRGRDEAASLYMKMGYTMDCAYAKAARKWAKTLEVFEYNATLSQEDQAAGRAKADDAFWDENDDEIPEKCRAK